MLLDSASEASEKPAIRGLAEKSQKHMTGLSAPGKEPQLMGGGSGMTGGGGAPSPRRRAPEMAATAAAERDAAAREERRRAMVDAVRCGLRCPEGSGRAEQS